MGNEDNLIPLNQRTQRERKEIASMGANATNKKIKEKKLFKQLMDSYLEMNVSNIETWNELSMAGFAPKDINNKIVIIKRLCDAAQAGDFNAIKLIMSMIGEDIQHEELKLKKRETKLKEQQAVEKTPTADTEIPMLYKALEGDVNDV